MGVDQAWDDRPPTKIDRSRQGPCDGASFRLSADRDDPVAAYGQTVGDPGLRIERDDPAVGKQHVGGLRKGEARAG